MNTNNNRTHKGYPPPNEEPKESQFDLASATLSNPAVLPANTKAGLVVQIARSEHEAAFLKRTAKRLEKLQPKIATPSNHILHFWTGGHPYTLAQVAWQGLKLNQHLRVIEEGIGTDNIAISEDTGIDSIKGVGAALLSTDVQLIRLALLTISAALNPARKLFNDSNLYAAHLAGQIYFSGLSSDERREAARTVIDNLSNTAESLRTSADVLRAVYADRYSNPESLSGETGQQLGNRIFPPKIEGPVITSSPSLPLEELIVRAKLMLDLLQSPENMNSLRREGPNSILREYPSLYPYSLQLEQISVADDEEASKSARKELEESLARDVHLGEVALGLHYEDVMGFTRYISNG